MQKVSPIFFFFFENFLFSFILLINDLQKKTDGRFVCYFCYLKIICVSTPPHTQVKNVTMYELRKRADRPPQGFKKRPLAPLVTKILFYFFFQFKSNILLVSFFLNIHSILQKNHSKNFKNYYIKTHIQNI